MITDRGKVFLKKYMANQAGAVAGAISLGIGSSLVSSTDTRLQFEFARTSLDIVAYDFINDRLIFKGNFPQSIVGKAYEVGIWTSEASTISNNQSSRIITTFDSATENWDVKTFDSTTARIGSDALRQAPAASGTATNILLDSPNDFSFNTSQDLFNLAYNCDNANTASITLRLRTDASNYYQFVINNPASGYNITTFAKGGATVVGSPRWSFINDIYVSTTAGSGGAASVSFDGLRIEDVDTFSVDYGLIARTVLGTPLVKPEGLVFDAEYALAVTI